MSLTGQLKELVIVGSGVAARGIMQSLKVMEEDISITVIRKQPSQVVPCAIPYVFKRLTPDGIKIGDNNWEEAGAKIIDAQVGEIDRENQKVVIQDGSTVRYDRLILATGADPIKPPVEGMDLEGVYFVEKDPALLSELQEKVMKSRRVAIIGGGFIGVELADELGRLEHLESIDLVEVEKHLLPRAFDSDFSEAAEKSLGSKVNLHLGDKVEKIQGEVEVKSVSLAGGKEISADLVICAIGVSPNTSPARDAGLVLGNDGGIIVDNYFYTSDPLIMACGDCTTKISLVDGREAGIRLASTAGREGIITGMNLQGKLMAQQKGVINNFSTKIGATVLGAAGMKEEDAVLNNYDIVTSSGVFPNRHPTGFDDVEENYVKLVFNRIDGRLLGGQVMGEHSVAELVNLIGTAVQENMTAFQLVSNQYATHPLLTTGPTGYPLLKLSLDAFEGIGKQVPVNKTG